MLSLLTSKRAVRSLRSRASAFTPTPTPSSGPSRVTWRIPGGTFGAGALRAVPVPAQDTVCGASDHGRPVTTSVAMLRLWRTGYRAPHTGPRCTGPCERRGRLWAHPRVGRAAGRGCRALRCAAGLTRRLADCFPSRVAGGHPGRVNRRLARCLSCGLADDPRRLRNSGNRRDALAGAEPTRFDHPTGSARAFPAASL